MGKKPTNKIGAIAENFAADFLSKKGYKIVGRNFRSRFGEIDIIALHDSLLVFVEVKARWSLKFGLPEEAVTAQKIWKITKTAEYYSLMHPNLPQSLRIEVVALVIENNRLKEARIIPVE